MNPTRLRPVAVGLLSLALVVFCTARCGGGGGGGGLQSAIQVAITKTANPTSVAPGGNVQFTIVVTNNDTEAFTVNSLNDSVFGDLATRCPGAVVGLSIGPGANRTCQFTAAVNGVGGTTHTNIATAVVENGSGETDQASASASVNIVAPGVPVVVVDKTASPTSVEAPGGNVQFTVVVNNTGTVSFTVNSLNDSIFGDLGTRCPGAVVGQVIAVGANRTCQFTAAVNGAAGTVHTNTATAVVQNGSGPTAQDSDDATVNIVAVVLNPTFTADTPSPAAPTISLAPGTVSGDQFQVLVRVTQINSFFGASLRIQFDPAFADFLSFSSTGTVIGGAPTLFDVFEPSSGILDVVATRQGAGIAGVNVGATSLLVTLTFQALQNTVGAEPFDIVTPRSVQVCPTAGQPCQKLADNALAWSGGDLTVN